MRLCRALSERGREPRSRARNSCGRSRKLTDEQKHNDRIMEQVLTKYESMRKVLGPFDEELEELWRATQRWTPALADLNKEQENTVTSVAELTKGLPALDIEVQNLGTGARRPRSSKPKRSTNRSKKRDRVR